MLTACLTRLHLDAEPKGPLQLDATHFLGFAGLSRQLQPGQEFEQECWLSQRSQPMPQASSPLTQRTRNDLPQSHTSVTSWHTPPGLLSSPVHKIGARAMLQNGVGALPCSPAGTHHPLPHRRSLVPLDPHALRGNKERNQGDQRAGLCRPSILHLLPHHAVPEAVSPCLRPPPRQMQNTSGVSGSEVVAARPAVQDMHSLQGSPPNAKQSHAARYPSTLIIKTSF